MRNIYILSKVTGAPEGYSDKIVRYAEFLKSNGDSVYIPQLDTDQSMSGFMKCRKNLEAIKDADEIHIFYNDDSPGSKLDIGMALALNKKIVIVENGNINSPVGKMLEQWLYLQDTKRLERI